MIDQTPMTPKGVDLPDEIDLRDPPVVAPDTPASFDDVPVDHAPVVGNDEAPDDVRAQADPDCDSEVEVEVEVEVEKAEWEVVSHLLFAPLSEIDLDEHDDGDPIPVDQGSDVTRPRLFAPSPGAPFTDSRTGPDTTKIRIFGPLAPVPSSAEPAAPPDVALRRSPRAQRQPAPAQPSPTIRTSMVDRPIRSIPAEYEPTRPWRRPLLLGLSGLAGLIVAIGVPDRGHGWFLVDHHRHRRIRSDHGHHAEDLEYDTAHPVADHAAAGGAGDNRGADCGISHHRAPGHRCPVAGTDRSPAAPGHDGASSTGHDPSHHDHRSTVEYGHVVWLGRNDPHTAGDAEHDPDHDGADHDGSDHGGPDHESPDHDGPTTVAPTPAGASADGGSVTDGGPAGTDTP